ncbi:MAG: hypothetical protein DHS20C14_10950 [Phycisphaeraceae bacterium]|nr:MAG: hypothetical protein DHS20C14_10950 [Phycisphaeraceae bacterium]
MHARHTTSAAIAALILSSGLGAAEPERIAIGTIDEPGFEYVHGCWEGPDGNLTGVRVLMPIDDAVLEHQMHKDAQLRGVADNRLDIVFVGDGYTAGEQGQFHDDAAVAISQLFLYEPFTSYEPYFRVHEIEVVSNESGVDNDPSQGISRDTALDMSFWCGGTERLLCVNVSKAYAFASLAPDVDQVIALANSTKYGGAGYPSSDLGTSSGGNGSSPQIAIHELGHSLGNLADEYTYGGPTTWPGGQPGSSNASVDAASQMAAAEKKWHHWLGYTGDSRFDGPVGTYEGCNYSVFGIYRPSNNSMMRNLNRKFNAVGAERLIQSFYAEVSPIDDHTPNVHPVAPDATLSVTPMQPLDHTLDVSWTLDGTPISGADGQTTLDLSTLGISSAAVVEATVVDNTDMVLKQSIRDNLLTQRVAWTVVTASCPADLTGDGSLNVDDVDAFVTLFIAGDLAVDFDVSGSLNVDDVDSFVAAFLAGCGGGVGL